MSPRGPQSIFSCGFAESVFRLLNLVSAFSEQSLEDAADVFVKQDVSGGH
ncbi:hypothetical protein PM076_17425 [Halorubrum ezzemoulense]|uniref:Uncharacterized protein n=1 Tax=Halorubrum ezzemoulense TaxID=337243 RepID=A0ABT4Z7G7_HALEZ|nr:hypothetical protein [Halorubrum ezzemoulense]MDB2246510.1 hypothetical protein [Halorubrum ezzemoulense]MDB2280139.1 hypothetical protein [Halorubrum ezzemoulense]MDB2290557.1 hypothetical protein [Halorubrum ezzemoulense]MDB2294030.1 hypothetical protein [Halorubrum ezzemoulense]MDB2298019.1 hypothetical protein [Halorubrum ezzemoulense]